MPYCPAMLNVQKILSKNRLLLCLFVIVGFTGLVLAGCSSEQDQFELISGEEAVIVLLRNEEVGSYRVRYTGSQPAEILNVQTMIAGEILHVDVQQVRLINGDREVVLVDNNVPEGQVFQVQPQDEIEMQVTYLGQSIGYNYLHGFRINFDIENNNQTFDVVDPEVPETYQYLIAVE